MNKVKFEKLKDSENLLKIDKDMVEIQNTIIFYGEKILFEIDDDINNMIEIGDFVQINNFENIDSDESLFVLTETDYTSSDDE